MDVWYDKLKIRIRQINFHDITGDKISELIIYKNFLIRTYTLKSSLAL